MLVSKARRNSQSDRSGSGSGSGRGKSSPKLPDLSSFIEARDYSGAIALLQFQNQIDESDNICLEWLAFCYFHNGDYEKAEATYKKLQHLPEAKPLYHTLRAACLFYLELYEESEEAALKGPDSALRTRILFHVAHHRNDEKKVLEYHGKIGTAPEDQLSLAAIHFSQMRYEEATEIYKRFLLENREWLALEVYMALCYYSLDQYDVSHEILSSYLQVHPGSAIAVNLKACNYSQLYDGKAAEAVIMAASDTGRSSLEQDLLRHNLVVFRNGEGALQVFPALIEVLPEARLNLTIHYLQNVELQQAYEVLKEFDPTTPLEYTVKAVACASLGQEVESAELIKLAQQYFQVVGASPTECDTILGRQCMASQYILLKKYNDAVVYLQSIKAFFENQDEFKWNYGMVKAGLGEFQEAEEQLLLISSDKYANDYYFQAWLLYCFIKNGKAHSAWEHFIHLAASDDSFSLLQMIANECYKTGQYLCSAKAFDALEKMDKSIEYWEGKRGACIGVIQNIINGREPQKSFEDVLLLLRNTSHAQAEYILRILEVWAKEKMSFSL